MKKILFLLLLLFCFVFSGYGINGNGSFGSPYNGPLTSNMTWSGTVYVNGDVTVNGFRLTVSSSTTVIFLASGTDIIITGTGVLIASGSSTNMIRFTADFNNNGIYGESGERWGHISFQNMTTTNPQLYPSIIDNCIIEYGQKNSSPSNVESYGGGIQTGFTYLTISNSTIRNSYAGWGGGIFINQNASPSISNCSVYGNSAANAGGGIYCWSNSNSVITNSLIFNNSSGSVGGGGVFLGDNCGNVRIINCTISNNSSSDPAKGQNIQFYYTPPNRIRFINSIIWGSNNSIDYSYYHPNVNDFTNCALQDVSTPAATFTICINLSGNNLDATGPNFNATDGSDWSIKFISPCRDAGIPTGAPLTDYLGNGRIGPYDIGAYEVQYNRWNGSANDNLWVTPTNWDASLDPGTGKGTGDIIIPSGLTNYPTGDPTVGYVMGSGKFMVLNPGAKATFNNLRTTGATLRLESDATGISSFIVNTNVTATVDLFLTGGNPGAPTLKLNKWHFISTPVTLLPVSTFAPTYTTNVVGWYDNQVSGTLASGWIAYDGYRYSTGGLGGPTFANLTPGNGYDFFATTDRKYTFSGQLNTGTFVMNLNFTTPPGSSSLNGFNLLGNPFSSGLDWDYILNNTPFPANTSKSLYFTRDNAQCSYINGVGIPSDVTGIIPPMQGFFIKTYSTGNSITLPAEGRVQGGIHARYKGLEIIPLVRLSLAEGTLTDETVVRFDPLAKSGLDYDFDAPKMFLSSDVLSIYTTSEGSDFAIDGLPFPDTFIEIPVVVNLTASGNHSITTTQLQGLDNYDVTLIDNTTGISTNLKTTPVLNFSASTGTIGDRFVMKVGTITTGIDNPVVSNNTFNIYPANNVINIRTVSDEWDGKSGSVRVIDLTGRNAGYFDNAEFSKNSLIQVAAPVTKGIYFVEIRSGVMRYVGKVIIK